MLKLKFLITLFIFTQIKWLAFGQAPNIIWEKSLGGSNWDLSTSIKICSDSGFIVSGITRSVDGDVIGHNSSDSTDAWIVKLNSTGNIMWQSVLGGSGIDYLHSIQETFDKGFISVGYTYSNDGDVTGNHGDRDIWIVKVDSIGNVQWQKCYGGTGQDDGFNVIRTSDRNYIVTGKSSSSGGNMTCGAGYYKFWVLKIDSTGNELWQKCYGGSNYNDAYSIAETNDGGYITLGNTASSDGDVSGFHGGTDYWIVKLDNTGNLQWQKSLGGTNFEYARNISTTTDGGYIVTGFTDSNNGDVIGNHGGRDFWIVKLNSIGNIQWQKCYGGSNGDEAYSIEKTGHSFVVTGFTSSQDGDVIGNSGGGGCWVLQIDSIGVIEWQKYLKTGGGGGYGIKQTNNGDFIIASAASIVGTDATANHGGLDYWIVRLGNTSVGYQNLFKEDPILKIYPNPARDNFTIYIKGNDFYNKTDLKITINNYLGQEIYNRIIEKDADEIEFNNLPNKGIYFVNLIDASGRIIEVQKLILQ